jgi:hypothetical protein
MRTTRNQRRREVDAALAFIERVEHAVEEACELVATSKPEAACGGTHVDPAALQRLRAALERL